MADAMKILNLSIARKRQYKEDRDRKLRERLEKPRAAQGEEGKEQSRANVAEEERKFKAAMLKK